MTAREPSDCNCCPPAEHLARVTVEDAAHAQLAAEHTKDVGDGGYETTSHSRALATAYRPGGLVDRAIADELDQMADRYPEHIFTPDGTSRDAIAGSALRTVLRAAARRRREVDR